MNEFVAGTLGGFAGKLLDYPFDTVKVLLQTQSVDPGTGKPTQYSSTMDCILKTYRTKGFLGFYKGISSPLVGSMAENALLFTSYGMFKSVLQSSPNEELPWLSLAMCGAGSGAVVPLVLTPVELIKCRLQVQQSARGDFKAYKGPIDCIVRTIKEEGISRGLYKGNVSTMLREIPGNFCWYGTYEAVCILNTPPGGKKEDCSPIVHMIGGGAAGAMYWTAFYPADTVKSVVQTNPEFSDETFLTVFKNIYRAEGIRGLYRGWLITVIRAVPAHAAIFAVYEQVMKIL